MPTRPADTQFPRQTAVHLARSSAARPLIDQVVSDMGAAVIGTQSFCSILREHDGFTRDCQFTAHTEPRHVFDDMPVPVAGSEILAGVHPGRVFPQCLLDDTERLDIIFQSIAPMKRRLPILLAIEIWLVAAVRPAASDNCVAVTPCSSSFCSTQV